MANKTKSRVSKTSTKKSGFQFHWWMALILVVIVGGLGIAVLRFSRASNTVNYYAADMVRYKSPRSDPITTLNDGGTKGNPRVVRLNSPENRVVIFTPPVFPGEYRLCVYGKTIKGPQELYVRMSDIYGYNTSGGSVFVPYGGSYTQPACTSVYRYAEKKQMDIILALDRNGEEKYIHSVTLERIGN